MIGYKFVTVAAACATVVSATPTFGLLTGHCGAGLFNFLWGSKNSCIPHGGYSQWYNPPAGHNCGERWYWNKDLGCCAPPHPGYPDAGCWSGYGWDDKSYSCVPTKGYYKE
ncbi:hypothetical protein FRC12_014575 [Ceratobasidium sp. 428]|nr:hypothetical protein FRC09_020019 [Ceratobasidium sp. 395]KAG8745289.1 hypothetical protein FRC12_014575 [Ceratobasidium sp. 428]